jgi:hypothetical protein
VVVHAGPKHVPPPPSEGFTHVNKDKHPHGPQLLLWLKDRERSPIWRQQRDAIARLREYLPQYTPEQLEQFRAMAASARACAAIASAAGSARSWGAFPIQELEPEQAPEQAVEQPAMEFDQAYWEQASEQLIERVPEQILPEQIDRVSEAEQRAGQLPEQSAEQIAEPVPKPQIEQAMQAPGRPRHRPRIEFPHLKESLADLEEKPHFKNMQPKEEVAFVMARLRQYGDTVEDRQEKTLSRRIAEWHADRTKRAR